MAPTQPETGAPATVRRRACRARARARGHPRGGSPPVLVGEQHGETRGAATAERGHRPAQARGPRLLHAGDLRHAGTPPRARQHPAQVVLSPVTCGDTAAAPPDPAPRRRPAIIGWSFRGGILGNTACVPYTLSTYKTGPPTGRPATRQVAPMSDGALRGTRLGATSYENDDHVELAPRQVIHYDCPKGHTTSMPFSRRGRDPGGLGVPHLRRRGPHPRRRASRGEAHEARAAPTGTCCSSAARSRTSRCCSPSGSSSSRRDARTTSKTA